MRMETLRSGTRRLFLILCCLVAALTAHAVCAQEPAAFVAQFGGGVTYNGFPGMPTAYTVPVPGQTAPAPNAASGAGGVWSDTILVSGETEPAPAPPTTLSNPPAEPAQLPSKEQKLGPEPIDFNHQFLRAETILLDPGEWQLDVGFNYTIFERNYTNLAIVDSSLVAVDSRITRRLLLAPLDFRLGLCEDLQAFVNVPFGWSNTQDSYYGYDEYANKGGIGDVTAGVSWQIHHSKGYSCSPDVIATFAFTAPTANVSPLQGVVDPPNTLLGQGFWFGSWNVLFVHTIDPVVFFYGFGSRHAVTRDYEGYKIRYGDQFLYRAGLGFAVNERVTLNATVTGSYITEPELNRDRIPGLAMEPVSLRLGATIAHAECQRFWDPFVEIGMTNDAPNTRVGVTFTY